jgi:hypothetical protein
METILGSFEAKQPNTWTGDVQYQVFVSGERLVAARTGGQFAGRQAQLITHQFGIIGVLVYRLFFAKRAARRRAEQQKALEACSMDELLGRHGKNFEVPFHAVKRAKVERVRFSMHGPTVARLIVEVQRGAPTVLLLPTAAQIEACRGLLAQPLEGRLKLDPKLPAAA